jgi:drug/metabolite transporter (DMT)-like permease
MTSKRRGYFFALTAIVIFTLQDAISKHLGSVYPPIFVTMIRYWVFAIFVVAMAARSRGGLAAAIRTKRPGLQIFRGVLLALQVVVVITCFSWIGLAHSQSIFAAAPLLVALLSVPILGEHVGWRRWSAIIIGLCGVLVILQPSGNSFDMRYLLAVLAAFMFSAYVITTRLASRSDSAVTSFLYTGIAGAVAISCIGPFFWTSMSPKDWIWMACLCVTGTSSHLFLIKAYEMLDATEVQPLTYLQLVFGSAVGVFVFGETLNANMIIGSVIVVGAGVFTIWRESVLARKALPLPSGS